MQGESVSGYWRALAESDGARRRPGACLAVLWPAALLAAGCSAGGRLGSAELGPAGLVETTALAREAGLDLAAGRPDAATRAADALAAAGGGRPMTGYVGVAGSILAARDKDLSGGWALDAIYTHNFTERFSLELSLGAFGYNVDTAGPDGGITGLALGAVAQAGMPFGSLRWYAGGGLGYWINDAWGLGGAEAGNSPALILVGGVDTPVAPAASLCLELRYAISTADLSPGGDVVLDALAVRVNYVFRR